MSRYRDLQDTIKKLEKELYMRNYEIQNAHEVCDKLDVPKSGSGAFVGHRLYWYSEGKRESNKTNDNTEGYSSGEWSKQKQKLIDIQLKRFVSKPRLPILK